ncbi:hypothetical protein RFI_22894, partial [Reticulomyxa filosa]
LFVSKIETTSTYITENCQTKFGTTSTSLQKGGKNPADVEKYMMQCFGIILYEHCDNIFQKIRNSNVVSKKSYIIINIDVVFLTLHKLFTSDTWEVGHLIVQVFEDFQMENMLFFVLCTFCIIEDVVLLLMDTNKSSLQLQKTLNVAT